MAVPESDTLTSTVKKFLKADEDLSEAKSKSDKDLSEAEAKFVQAWDMVSSVSLNQSQYGWLLVGQVLQGLSKSGYATEVNQVIQAFEIQCAEAPPETEDGKLEGDGKRGQ